MFVRNHLLRLVLLSMICGAASSLRADQPDSPAFHFFAVPSQNATCYAVHSVRPWGADLNVAKYGRIQLFRADNGAELWRIEGVLCYQGEIFPADDLKHLVIVRSGFSLRRMDSVPVVLFYAEGRVLKSYTLKDLSFDLSKLEKSVSSGTFARAERALNNWTWEWGLEGKDGRAEELPMGGEQNPTWRGTVLELRTLDGQQFRFEGKTGNLLEAKKP